MKDIKEMISNLKNSIDENKQQKEINLELVQIIETLASCTSRSEIQITKEQPTLFEFLKKRDVSQNNDIILNIAYYNENFRGISSFSAEEIKNQYEMARLKPPKNINDFLAKLERNKGYIIECKEKKDGKKTWKLSSSGITYVESLIQ